MPVGDISLKSRRFLRSLLLFWVVGGFLLGGPGPGLGAEGASGEKEIGVRDGLEGKVSVGATGVGLNRESFKFGEYSGISESTGYFVGEAELYYTRDVYFMDFFAEDVGLENRSLHLQTGKFGDYEFWARFDQLPHLLSNTSKTPLDGAGSSFLTRPAGFGRANTTSGMTITGIKGIDLEVDQRQAEAFGLSKKFGKYEFDLSFKREDKDGVKSLGGTFGSNGGNARAVVLPEVFDQTVNEVQASLAHNGEEGQVQLEYFLSYFDNKIESLFFQSPFSTSAVLADAGLISRPPDNQYHRVSLTGGYNLSQVTRVSAIAEYGLMSQDESLLPFGVGTSASLLPRSTADAEIQTLHFTLNVSSQPTSRLGIRAKYRHYQTINETPQDLFLYINNDAGGQVAITSSDALFNQPYDSVQNQAGVDLSYLLFRATRLKLGYEVELVNRDFREVEETVENTFKAGLRSGYFSFAEWNVRFAYSTRIGDKYDSFRVFNNRHTQQFVTPGDFDSLPELRRSDIANRDRVKLGANVTFFPATDWVLGLNLNFQEDDYPNSEMGLRYARIQDATLDASYVPSEQVNTYAFYTVQRSQFEQNGRSHNPFAAGSETDPTRNWRVDFDEWTHTVGVGSSLTFLENRLTWSTDYSFSQSLVDITFATGTSLTSDNLPNLRTSLHQFKSKLNYQVSSWVDVSAQYLLENYLSDDFAIDGFDGASADVDNVLLLSGLVPDYNAHVGWLVLSFYPGGRD